MEYYTIILALLLTVSICDTTLLWRINVNPPAYILGTAHIPYPLIWPSLSQTARSAFENSTHYLPEFDVTNFFLFTRFRLCLDAHMSTFNNGRPPPPPPPGFVGQIGSQAPILDINLALEARRLKKNVTSLESVEMYCEFTTFQAESLANQPPPPPLPLSNINVQDEVKRTYDCDFNCPGEFFPPSTAMNIPDKTLLAFKQRLDDIVHRRDVEMAEKINKVLKEGTPNDRLFIAVGYVHVLNPDGIIGILKRDYKYSVTRLCTDSSTFRSALRCFGPSWCDPIAGL